MIEAWCGERTTAEIVELATLLRIPCIEVGNGASIPTMDHFAAAPFYDVNPDGGFLQPAAPFRMHPPIPGVGEVRAAPPLGPPIRAVDRVRRRRRPRTPLGAAGTRPFEGLRVADFTSFWAGPFLGHVLGMFGADVIHVESTGRPDGARLMNWHPRTEAQWWERSSYFHATNTNKRGVTLDLSRRGGSRAGPPPRRRVRRDRRELQPPGDGVVRVVVGRRPGHQPAGDHGADAGVRPVRAVARPHRLRHDDGAGVGHGVAVRLPRARPGRAVRAVRSGRRAARPDRAVRRPSSTVARPARGGSSSARWWPTPSTSPASRSSSTRRTASASIEAGTAAWPPPRRTPTPPPTGTTTSTSTAGCRSRWPPTSSGERCGPRSASRRGRPGPSSTRRRADGRPRRAGRPPGRVVRRAQGQRDRRRAVVGRRPVRRRRAPVGEPDHGAARPPPLLRIGRAPRPRRRPSSPRSRSDCRTTPVPSTAARRRCSASTTPRCSVSCSA